LFRQSSFSSLPHPQGGDGISQVPGYPFCLRAMVFDPGLCSCPTAAQVMNCCLPPRVASPSGSQECVGSGYTEISRLNTWLADSLLQALRFGCPTPHWFTSAMPAGFRQVGSFLNLPTGLLRRLSAFTSCRPRLSWRHPGRMGRLLSPSPHRPERAALPHSVPQQRHSLPVSNTVHPAAAMVLCTTRGVSSRYVVRILA